MVVLEQLVFGPRAGGGSGREILGNSPGVSRECAQEIVHLCEGWGAIPAGGLRRRVLLSFPLEARLSAMPGPLYAVIRVAQGLKPVYHAVVLSRTDYVEFGLNPFSVEQEDVFLEQWSAGEELPRRNLEPGSLAPVVAPPPAESDVGSVDEGVRQMLANQRLLLPLELPSSDSDRFLALIVAGLPRSLQLELRFGSWSPSGANRYTLAATYHESALFTSWQPFLMTSVLGALHQTCEEYLEQFRRCLRDGDLTSLERLGVSNRVELGRSGSNPNRQVLRPLASTVDERSAKRIESTKTPVARDRGATAAGTDSRMVGRAATIRSSKTRPSSSPGPRPRPVRRRGADGTRRGLAAALSMCIFVAGAYYLWTSGHWTHLPGFNAGGVSLNTRSQFGVVDVAGIYEGALKSLSQGVASSVGLSEDSRRRQGLERLQQAGELLDAQGQDYLEQSDQTLDGAVRNGIAPAPADRLHDRGRVLARELRRLALARVSLREFKDWQDLSGLDVRALEVRLDSLLASRHGRGTLEPGLVAVNSLLRGVDLKTRQIGGLSSLEVVLAQEEWDPQWDRRCAAAIDDLGGVGQQRARRLRADAGLLLRLKRAEHATDFATRAYQDRYSAATVVPQPVAELLPSVLERGHRMPASDTPALLRATADFYDGLREASDPATSRERRAGLLEVLPGNRALAFDFATYENHVGRLFFEFAASADSTAAVGADDERTRECLAFAAARAEGYDAAGWRRLSGELHEPFLMRWAAHEAETRESSRRTLQKTFAGDVAVLAQQRETFLRLAMAGGRCGPAWRDLASHAATVRETYRGVFPDMEPDAETWTRVAALAADVTTPPSLRLGGITVRVDPAAVDAPGDVIVELLAGSNPVRRSPSVRLGPSAPAGTGWVGNCGIDWDVPLAAGEPLTVRVLEAAGGAELSRTACEGWLVDCDPQRLAGPAADQGVRVSWRLARPYWDTLALTEVRR